MAVGKKCSTPSLVLTFALVPVVAVAGATSTRGTDSESSISWQETQPALGRAAGYRQTVSATPAGSKMSGEAIVLGQSVPIWEAVAFATPDGTTPQVRSFSRGLRVWDTSAGIEDGKLKFKAALPPAEVRVPTWVYPIGPALLMVDAGVQFEADVHGEVQAFFYYPVKFTTVQAKAEATGAAAALAAGQLRVVIARTGLEGRVDLADGSVNAKARFTFNGSKPQVSYSGKLRMLAGSILAFFDMRSLWGGSWKRLWEKPLIEWPGIVRSFTSEKPGIPPHDPKESGNPEEDPGDFH